MINLSPSETTHVCSYCKQEKPLDQFRLYRKPDGEVSAYCYCRICATEYQRLYRAKQRVIKKKKYPDRDSMKYCRTCKQYVNKSEFATDSMNHCKTCVTEKKRSGRITNKATEVEVETDNVPMPPDTNTDMQTYLQQEVQSLRVQLVESQNECKNQIQSYAQLKEHYDDKIKSLSRQLHEAQSVSMSNPAVVSATVIDREESNDEEYTRARERVEVALRLVDVVSKKFPAKELEEIITDSLYAAEVMLEERESLIKHE